MEELGVREVCCQIENSGHIPQEIQICRHWLYKMKDKLNCLKLHSFRSGNKLNSS